jgi:hypothetical protein
MPPAPPPPRARVPARAPVRAPVPAPPEAPPAKPAPEPAKVESGPKVRGPPAPPRGPPRPRAPLLQKSKTVPQAATGDLTSMVLADDYKPNESNKNLARMSKIQKALYNRHSILRPDQQNKLTEGENKAN